MRPAVVSWGSIGVACAAEVLSDGCGGVSVVRGLAQLCPWGLQAARVQDVSGRVWGGGGRHCCLWTAVCVFGLQGLGLRSSQRALSGHFSGWDGGSEGEVNGEGGTAALQLRASRAQLAWAAARVLLSGARVCCLRGV